MEKKNSSEIGQICLSQSPLTGSEAFKESCEQLPIPQTIAGNKVDESDIRKNLLEEFQFLAGIKSDKFVIRVLCRLNMPMVLEVSGPIAIEVKKEWAANQKIGRRIVNFSIFKKQKMGGFMNMRP